MLLPAASSYSHWAWIVRFESHFCWQVTVHTT